MQFILDAMFFMDYNNSLPTLLNATDDVLTFWSAEVHEPTLCVGEAGCAQEKMSVSLTRKTEETVHFLAVVWPPGGLKCVRIEP